MNRLASVYALSLASLATGVALAGGCTGSGGGGLGIQPLPVPDPPNFSNVGPRPNFGATVTAAVTPPAISGGTLIVSKDGKSAIAADPDRDQVYIVDLGSRAVTTVALQPGDEPGRLAEDANHRVHVALRGGGALVTIDLATRQVLGRRPVCAAPRGVAYDAKYSTANGVTTDAVWVACMGGELVALSTAGGTYATLHLDRDIRDVVVDGDNLLLSRFRSAEILKIDRSGLLLTRDHPEQSLEGATASIAWKLSALPSGGVAMLHQRGQNSKPISTQPGGYSSGGGGGGGCDRSIVETAVTFFDHGARTSSPALSDAIVPVDFAMSPVGQGFVVIAAGNSKTPELQQVLLFQEGIQASAPPVPCAVDGDGGMVCGDDAGGGGGFGGGGGGGPGFGGGGGGGPGGGGGCTVADPVVKQPPGQATAAVFTTGGTLIVQTREPAALFFPETEVTIPLSSISREDTGHAIFHANAGGFLACASCHAEGGDDGRTWDFDTIGPRRTPTLRGTIEGTAPYHWGGEMTTFSKLSHEVFTGRMSGAPLQVDQNAALQGYVNKIPAVASMPSTGPLKGSASNGAKLFDGAAGCTGCHSGPKFTNNQTVDVGTGGKFQVPSLVGVAHRAPFLHQGCATTLEDRFGACGGTMHGNTAGLTGTDIADLVAFLESL